jgi:hypothetical protein
MTQRMQDLAGEIVRLQGELDREIEQRRKVLGWRIKNRMVEFEQGLTAEHRLLRKKVANLFGRSFVGMVLTAPVIYSMFIPLGVLDAWISLYQAICFRAYQIPRVPRARYMTFDRRRLGYLNWIETLNCSFCEYANGVLAYAREIGARTEQFWCPIKHALKITDPHRRYYDFLEFGDAEGYRARLDDFRDRLRADGAAEREKAPS